MTVDSTAPWLMRLRTKLLQLGLSMTATVMDNSWNDTCDITTSEYPSVTPVVEFVAMIRQFGVDIYDEGEFFVGAHVHCALIKLQKIKC